MAAPNRPVPVILDGYALKDKGEDGREQPGSHKTCQPKSDPAELFHWKDMSVESEDAPFDVDDNDGI